MGIRLMLESDSALKLSQVVLLYIGYVCCEKSFWSAAPYHEIKNKNMNFREFRPIMGQ